MLLRDFLWRLKRKYVVLDFHPLVLLYALGVLGVLTNLKQVFREMDSSDDGTNVTNQTLSNLIVTSGFLAAAMACDREANQDLDRTDLDEGVSDGQSETPLRSRDRRPNNQAAPERNGDGAETELSQ